MKQRKKGNRLPVMKCHPQKRRKIMEKLWLSPVKEFSVM